MVKLEFFYPSGAQEAPKPHAPRLDSLAGKRIGFVSNDQWQAYRMLPLIKSMLVDDFADIEVLPIDQYPQGNTLIGDAETAKLIKLSDVDAAIIGNAA